MLVVDLQAVSPGLSRYLLYFLTSCLKKCLKKNCHSHGTVEIKSLENSNDLHSNAPAIIMNIAVVITFRTALEM